VAGRTRRARFDPGFVRAPAPVRQLRDLTRLRSTLTSERSREIQRLEKLLEDAGIKLSSVATDIMGVSGRAMLAALIDGVTDPADLADLAKADAFEDTGADRGADRQVQ
jgi:transposase